MSTTVQARASARQPKSHSTRFQLSALSLVSATIIHGVTRADPAWTMVILVIVLVVVVSVTSPGSVGRRRFGLDLPGLLLRYLCA
jgi:hypothetical protein